MADGRWQIARRWGFIALILFFALFCFASVTHAQQPTPNLDDVTLRVAKGLYCPVCPGVPLDVCETQACVQWRALIREKLAAGQTEDQIRQYFVDQYGERVLGAPRDPTVFILPFLALAAGIAILFFTIRGWVRSRATAASLPAQISVAPEIAERIAREMKERE